MTSSPRSDGPRHPVLYYAVAGARDRSTGPGFIECDDGKADLLELCEHARCGDPDRDPSGGTRIRLDLVFAGDIAAASVIQHLYETFNDDGSLLEAREL